MPQSHKSAVDRDTKERKERNHKHNEQEFRSLKRSRRSRSASNDRSVQRRSSHSPARDEHFRRKSPRREREEVNRNRGEVRERFDGNHRSAAKERRDDFQIRPHVKREPMSEDDRERRQNERRRIEDKKVKREQLDGAGEDHQKFAWGKQEPTSQATGANAVQPKEKPTLELSGKLAADTNTYKGVVIKYNQPPEACKPKIRWRLYPFKGSEQLGPLYIHRESAYLIGRERKIADIATDHPSCSKQHAVLQYRLIPYERPDGSKGRAVRPYIIDLSSANGTFLNSVRIEPQRYYELKEKDVLKFGFSSREYVLLHEGSKEDVPSDDEEEEEKSPSSPDHSEQETSRPK